VAEPDGGPEPHRAAALIHSAAIQLLRFVRKEDLAAGLSAAQLSALSVLVFGGPQTMSSLAAAEQLRMPTLSRTVTELERQGLALRSGREDDRRVIEVRVTDAGRKLLEAGRNRRLARLVAALGSASGTDLATLIAAAQIILQATGARDGRSGEVAGD
jgi:DNA-binding MarR family transcriptional regulator